MVLVPAASATDLAKSNVLSGRPFQKIICLRVEAQVSNV